MSQSASAANREHRTGPPIPERIQILGLKHLGNQVTTTDSGMRIISIETRRTPRACRTRPPAVSPHPGTTTRPTRPRAPSASRTDHGPTPSAPHPPLTANLGRAILFHCRWKRFQPRSPLTGRARSPAQTRLNDERRGTQRRPGLSRRTPIPRQVGATGPGTTDNRHRPQTRTHACSRESIRS